MSSQKKWIAFMLNDKFASVEEKANLKKNIMAKFNRDDKDICYTSFKNDNGTSYYFFVKQQDQENDLRQIHEEFKNCFQSFFSHVKITEDELKGFFNSIEEKEKVQIKFGDLVKIKSGYYNKLYGIVLRQGRYDKYDVGLKFGFGVILQSYSPKELQVVGNIFNYIKVLH